MQQMVAQLTPSKLLTQHSISKIELTIEEPFLYGEKAFAMLCILVVVMFDQVLYLLRTNKTEMAITITPMMPLIQ